MSDTTAARLLSLNQQAIAILGLNIPLDFGLGSETAERLRDINERLIVDVGRDLSPDALLEEHDLPERYRAIARMLLASDDPVPVFESIAIQELDRDAAAGPLRQAIKEPLTVAGLAYIGMIILCVFSVPSIETQYTRARVGPQRCDAVVDCDPWGDALLDHRRSGPADRVLVDLASTGQRPAVGTLSRRHRVLASAGCRITIAAIGGADRVGCRTRNGTLAGRHQCFSAHPIRPIAESIVRNGTPQSQSRALTRLAGFYHFLAGDRRQTFFAKAPALIGLLVAGLIVLGYGLATFLPWIAVLQTEGVTEALNR